MYRSLVSADSALVAVVGSLAAVPPLRALRRILLVLLASILLGLVACAGCSSGTSSPKGEPAGCTKVSGTSYTLVARNLAWVPTCLQVKAGSTVNFTVKLEDIGVQHNLVVYGQGKSQQTKLQTGPATQHLSFTFTNAGYYQYKCSIHPNMTGVIYAV